MYGRYEKCNLLLCAVSKSGIKFNTSYSVALAEARFNSSSWPHVHKMEI